MTDTTHDEMRDLVAAYALHATDPDEETVVEAHLGACPRCRAELAAHRETASFLGYAGAAPPEGLWDRIAANVTPQGEAPPPPRIAPRRPRRLLAVLAAAAAVVVVGGLGASLAHEAGRISQLSKTNEDVTLLRQATAAGFRSDATHVALADSSGAVRAETVVLPDGRGYLLAAAMNALPSGRTYQLWGIVGGRPVSAGVLGSDPLVAAFRAVPGETMLAVTVEPAGGSPRPTTSPVAFGQV